MLGRAEIGLVLGVSAAAGIAWALLLRRQGSGGLSISTQSGKGKLKQGDKKGTGKEKPTGPKIDVYFGSQTGTAEDFAKAMSLEGRAFGYDMHAVDLEKFDPDTLRSSNSIFLVATYGEGDPTDNSKTAYKWLQEAENGSLSGLQYAVFGLGNTQYEQYNSMGKFFDKELERVGGHRLFDLGLGDDDKNIQEDFDNWREQIWPALGEVFGFEQSSATWMEEGVKYRLKMKTFPSAESANKFKQLKSSNTLDEHKYVQMTVTENRELYRGDRSCRHIELDITGLGQEYITGDHIGILPENDKELVEKLAARLNADLDEWITLEDENGEAPFPCPCTIRQALTRYIDINSSPKKSVLVALAEASTSQQEKEKLLAMASKQGKDLFFQYVHQSRRNVLDLLVEFNSVSLNISQLLEILPRMQPRYYSISSASATSPSSVHVTAVVVKESLPDSRVFKGVCTNFLASAAIGARVLGACRRTTFKLPQDPSVSVIMVGAGTGLAPMRGMYLHLEHLRQQGAKLGENMLIFGCRRRAEDFLYEDEIYEAKKSGALTHVVTAFSRDDEFRKVYVQNKVDEKGRKILELLEGGAYFYICGNTLMAKDVRKALLASICFLRNYTQSKAEAFLEQLHNEGRYHQDVWSS